MPFAASLSNLSCTEQTFRASLASEFPWTQIQTYTRAYTDACGPMREDSRQYEPLARAMGKLVSARYVSSPAARCLLNHHHPPPPQRPHARAYKKRGHSKRGESFGKARATGGSWGHLLELGLDALAVNLVLLLLTLQLLSSQLLLLLLLLLERLPPSAHPAPHPAGGVTPGSIPCPTPTRMRHRDTQFSARG